MIKQLVIFLGLGITCYGAGLVNGTLSPVVGSSGSATPGAVTTSINPAYFKSVTNLTVIGCPTAAFNTNYVLMTPTTNYSPSAYLWWKQVNGNEYLVQNDPNFIVNAAPYVWTLSIYTNDETGFSSDFELDAGTLNTAAWTGAGQMLAYFNTTPLTNNVVVSPQVFQTTNVFYVDASPLGNDLNNGLTAFTPFKTLARACSFGVNNTVIYLSPGMFTNDSVGTIVSLSTGCTIQGSGLSTFVTNVVFRMGNNCTIANMKINSPQGIEGGNMDGSNVFSRIEGVDCYSPADGIFNMTIAGELFVKNCYFHSANDTANIVVNGDVTVDNSRFECIGTAAGSVNGTPLRAFYAGAGTGTVHLANSTFLISNCSTNVIGGGQTNLCIGASGGHLFLGSGVNLYNTGSQNRSVLVYLSGSGVATGNYSYNGTNTVYLNSGMIYGTNATVYPHITNGIATWTTTP